MSLWLMAVASAANAVNQKTVFGSGITTVIIPNNEFKGIIKIIISFVFIVKGCKWNNWELNKRKKGDFSILLGTLGPSSLTNLWAVKAVKARKVKDFTSLLLPWDFRKKLIKGGILSTKSIINLEILG